MATVLFVVKATITKDREEAFNRWYNDEHVPQVLQFKGVVSARRYKALEGEEKYQYMAVYEFQDEVTYRRFKTSDHLKALVSEYDAHFGGRSEEHTSELQSQSNLVCRLLLETQKNAPTFQCTRSSSARRSRSRERWLPGSGTWGWRSGAR